MQIAAVARTGDAQLLVLLTPRVEALAPAASDRELCSAAAALAKGCPARSQAQRVSARACCAVEDGRF